MSVTCLLITTNVAKRLHLLRNTVTSIERCKTDLFDRKVMSVDIFEDEASLSHFDQYRIAGWEIVSGPSAGRNGIVNNQRRGLAHVQTDHVLYTEDDILINRIPSKAAWGALSTRDVRGKGVGFICFNTHVFSNPERTPQERLDFINNENNYVQAEGELFLAKGPVLRDEYYLNFPVAITSKEIFTRLHEYAASRCNNQGVEVGLTNAWFGTGLDQKWESLIYLKPDAWQRKPFTAQTFYYEANMNFWNNDTGLRHDSINGRENSYF
jgi:hypothetical protein